MDWHGDIPPEVRAAAVEAVRRGEKIAVVARRFGVGAKTLSRWVRGIDDAVECAAIAEALAPRRPLQECETKPPWCSDVRWRIELRRRAKPWLYRYAPPPPR